MSKNNQFISLTAQAETRGTEINGSVEKENEMNGMICVHQANDTTLIL